jgi:hypothetical protein
MIRRDDEKIYEKMNLSELGASFHDSLLLTFFASVE